MNKKKIALIGCGSWGVNFVRVISQNNRCELSMVCDKDFTKLDHVKNINSNIILTDNYQEIAKNPDIEGVVVATNVASHYEIVKNLLSQGKHVLCEKPLTRTLKEAIDLKQISDKNNSILMVGHVFLFNDGINYIKKLLEKKEIGEIKYINFKRTGLGPIRKDVNVIWDLATHDISILLYLLEKKPLSVIALAKSFYQKDIEDVAYINFEFEDNVFANIHVSWIEPIKQRIITFVGSSKMIVFDDISVEEKVKIYDKGVSYQTFSGDYGDFKLAIRDGKITIPNIKYNEPLKMEFDCFLKHLYDNTHPISNSSMALQIIQLLEAAQKSSDNNNVKILL